MASNIEKHSENCQKWLPILKNIVTMVLKNNEEGVEISFKTVEKEDEEVKVRFFFFFFFLQNWISFYPPDIEIRNTTGFNKSGLQTIPDIKIRIVLL